MIHPDTYTKRTEKGIGLFAKRDFCKGEIIWLADRETDQILPSNQYLSLPKSQKEKINWLGYLDRWGRFVMPGDNGLYINHSCDPNCTYLLEFDNISIAKQDIRAGEEITENYRCYYGHIESFECKCGASKCMGHLNSDAPFQPSLRLSLRQVRSLILSHHQPLLAVDFEQKTEFIKTLNTQDYGHSEPKNIFARLAHKFQMELAFPAAAH